MFSFKKRIFSCISFCLLMPFSHIYSESFDASLVTSQQLTDELKAIEASKKHLFFNALFPSLGILPKGTKIYRIHADDAPQITQMIKSLTERLNMSQPLFLCVMKDKKMLMSNNAAATGFTHRLGCVLIGAQLIETLTPQQLEAVLAHELGHLKKYHMIKKTCFAAVSTVAIRAFWNSIIEPCLTNNIHKFRISADVNYAINSWGKKVFIGLTPLLASMAYSRFHEKEADQIAASAIANPVELGSALEQLETNDFNNKNAISRWFSQKLSWLQLPTPLRRILSTHPLTKDRVAYLKDQKNKIE